jgi:hypothetical protein
MIIYLKYYVNNSTIEVSNDILQNLYFKRISHKAKLKISRDLHEWWKFKLYKHTDFIIRNHYVAKFYTVFGNPDLGYYENRWKIESKDCLKVFNLLSEFKKVWASEKILKIEIEFKN